MRAQPPRAAQPGQRRLASLSQPRGLPCTPYPLQPTPYADVVVKLDAWLEAEAVRGATREKQALEGCEVHAVYYREGQALTRAHIWRDGASPEVIRPLPLPPSASASAFCPRLPFPPAPLAATLCGVVVFTCGACGRGRATGFDMNQWEREWNWHTGAFVDGHLPTWYMLSSLVCVLAC